MRKLDKPLTTEVGKHSKNKNSRRGKSFGYQVLGFGSGGAGSAFVVASGGTPACGVIDGDYKYHTFTGPGTFCVTAGTCVANNDVAYMVVGGGGAGGWGTGGGGGGGGYREGKNNCLTPYTASPIAAASGITVTTQGYPITVGAGTPAGCVTNPAGCHTGNLSTFSTITSAGGGGGASGAEAGAAGGSGGAGGYTWAGVHVSIPAPNAFKGAGDTPNVTPDQGFPGGKGWDAWYSGILTGGGGGASEAGVCATSSGPGGSATGTAGRGGAGTTSSITAAPVAYAGGAGGTAYGIHLGSINPGNSGAASPCGTGKAAGGPLASRSGTTNRGGGGGGAGGPGGVGCAGGSGGSGVVVIRYKFQ